jgi:hypothetical protein
MLTTATPKPNTDADVLVIGAGPAGIASAYALEQAGIAYKVIDRADITASTWDSLYPSLKLNTSRFYSHMPEAPFPVSYGLFPSARQYHAYVSRYVAEQAFNIQLGVEVYRVAREPGTNLWRVESSEGTSFYPVVITATGIFGNPIMPDIPGMDAFQGTIMHSSSYKRPEQIRGQRVLVVGNGPSGVDIAVEAAINAAHTWIGIRSGVDLRPRYPYGLPMHLWLMLADNLPREHCQRIMKWAGSRKYPNIAQYGLKSHPPGAAATTAYRGPELLDVVRAGQIEPVEAPTQFEAHQVTLADGTQIEPDMVIMATGFTPVLHRYLDIDMQYNSDPYRSPAPCDWRIGPNGQRGWPLRDVSEHPNGRQILGHPGLYLVGTFYKGKGAMFNMNVEAAIAADQIKRYLAEHTGEFVHMP